MPRLAVPEDMKPFLVSTADRFQVRFKFDNSLGASVIHSSYSYGNADGLFELAVLQYLPGGNYTITYDTPLTDDVIGYLDSLQVASLLYKIQKLKGTPTK